MNTFVRVISIALLLALVPFLFYGTVSVAQSIIVLALTSLVGFQYYLEDQTKPDYHETFKADLEAYKAELDAKYDVSQKHYKEIREAYGKFTFNNKKNTSGPDSWTF